MIKIAFEVPMACKPKKNSRPIFRNKKTGKSFIGKGKGLVQFEDDAIMILKSQMWKHGAIFPITERLRVKYYFRFRDHSRADLDNLVTSAQDLLISKDCKILQDDKIIRHLEAQIHDESGLDDMFRIEIESIGRASVGPASGASIDSVREAIKKKLAL